MQEVKILERQVDAMKKELFQLCWYMRGGLSVEEAHYLSWTERETIGNMVKENLETTKKTGMPFF